MHTQRASFNVLAHRCLAHINAMSLHEIVESLQELLILCVQYGLSGPLDELDLDSIDVLREAFASDPAWSSKVSLLESP